LGASRPRVDALNSVFTTAWFSLLPDALQAELADEAILSRCREILLGLVSGTSKIEEFAFVQAVLGDGPIPAQFQELMKDAILATKCDDLLTQSESIRFAVLVSVAHLGGVLPGETSAHIRTQLLQLCKVLQESAIAADEKEDMLQTVLSAAFELYRSGRPNEEKYNGLSSLLSALVSECPQIAEQCQVLVDALVQGLPNIHSRLFWKLQIMLRAVR
jgi:hypothetical protein